MWIDRVRANGDYYFICTLFVVMAFLSVALSAPVQAQPIPWVDASGNPVYNPGGTNALAPVVAYNPITGLITADTRGVDRIAESIDELMAIGDDVGMISILVTAPEVETDLLLPLFHGDLLIIYQYFAGKHQIHGTVNTDPAGVYGQFMPVGVEPLLRTQAGLDATQFGAVEMGIAFADRMPGATLFTGNIAYLNTGDFDQDDLFTCGDVDALSTAVANQSTDLDFDLTGDNLVNYEDLRQWLTNAGAIPGSPTGGAPFQIGDANLDGQVDVSDFDIWLSHKYTAGQTWCSGDFTANGNVDTSDFNLWNQHKFTTAGPALIPEPTAWCFLISGMICLTGLTRARF